MIGAGIFAADTKPPTIQEIEQLPFDDAFQQWGHALQSPTNTWNSITLTDLHNGRFTPSAFWALTCRLGNDAHLHESSLVSALNSNALVSLILDTSPVLCSKYAVNSEAMVTFDPIGGYAMVMRSDVEGPDGRRSVWLDAISKTNSQPSSAPPQGSQVAPARDARAVSDTSAGYLPLLDLPKERLSTASQKIVESVTASKVPSKEEALAVVLRFAADKADYMRRADMGMQVEALVRLGRDVPGFASASDCVWVVHTQMMDNRLMQVFYVSSSTGKVLTVFSEDPSQTVQRTGSSRSAQETNRTSSAAGSRRSP